MPGLELRIPAAGGAPETPAYAHFPDGAKRGMVVIHEIYGRQPEIDRVVERFAAAGYAAIAPDLFASGKLGCIREVFGKALKEYGGVSVEKAKNARALLTERTGIQKEHIGLIGFCFGGAFALCAGSGWAAVSTNYGEVPASKVMEGIGPVMGCYGGRDRMFRDKGTVLTKRLARVGVVPEVHVFPTEGHSLLTDGHHPVNKFLTWPVMHISYDPKVAEEGWAKILDFMGRHL